MINKNLDLLLLEYDEKRKNAELNYEKQKQNIYKSFPRIKEIDDEINTLSINKAKSILANRNIKDELDKKLNNLKQEKENILKKENIDLKIHYDCDICKDTGYITRNNKKTIMCNCLKQKLLNINYNRSNLSSIKNECFENFNENLFSDKIDEKRYKFKISPRNNIITIKKACINFVNNFDDLNEKNLLFFGNTGLGKTYMSNCIANKLIENGKTVLYQTAPVLLETIIDNKFNKYKNQNSDDFYNTILNVDLLIIDDLGTEYLNNIKLSELFTIINTRILNLNNKPTKTIISTNLTIEQIFKVYQERIGSRISGFYDIYPFFGEDIRLMPK